MGASRSIINLFKHRFASISMTDAISLTKKMDELFAAGDMAGMRAMYHPDVESLKPNGDTIKGVEANFGDFEKMISNQFPKMAADQTYKTRKQNTFKDGKLTKVTMVGQATASQVYCPVGAGSAEPK